MSATGQATGGPVVRLPVAVLVVVATVVAALLVVALVVRLDADRLPSGPPRDPPPPPPEPTSLSVDSDRTVRFQDFSMTLAGPPYGCGDTQAPAGFTDYQGCSLVVHGNYDPAGHDWFAVTGVLLVGDALVRGDDLTATTKAVFDSLVRQSYAPDQHPSVSKVSEVGVQLAVPAGRSASRLANVDVDVLGLPTPYDRFAVVVVRLDSGRHVAFFSAFPHDGSKAALQAVSSSLSTIALG